MCIKRSLVLLFLGTLLEFVVLCSPAIGEDGPQLTKEQVLDLLPMGVDMLDSTATDNYDRLVDAGPRAYPALAELLNETDDPIIIGRIFAVFAESTGDKTIALSAVTNVIGRYRNLDTAEARKVRVYAAQTVSKIGSEADAVVLLQELLQDSDERVRVNVIRALSKMDNERVLAVIEKFIASRRAVASEESIAKDRSVQEAKTVVDRINRERHDGGIHNEDK